MLGDATTTAQLTSADRAQGAAVAWAALVAIAERAPAHVVSALVSLVQSTYGRYRPAFVAQAPTVTYATVPVDGLYGPKTATAVSILIAQVATSVQQLRNSGFATVFPTKINSTTLVAANFAEATTVANRLSDTTDMYEAVGFQDLGRSVYDVAKRGRNAREATTNAVQFLSAQATTTEPESAATATTVTSTRSTSEGFIQTMVGQTQVPSSVAPVIPGSSTPGQVVPVSTGGKVQTGTDQTYALQNDAGVVSGRRWSWFTNPKIVVPVSLLALFLGVWGLKHWKKGRR